MFSFYNEFHEFNLCCLKLASIIPSASYDISQHKVEYGVSLDLMLGNHYPQHLVLQLIHSLAL